MHAAAAALLALKGLTYSSPSPSRAPQAYLSLCQGNHYQYDTIRRAKHSSMMTLYHLHNPTAPAFTSTCNVCNQEIEAGSGFRCTVCPDFDICAMCRGNGHHDHHPLQVRLQGNGQRLAGTASFLRDLITFHSADD